MRVSSTALLVACLVMTARISAQVMPRTISGVVRDTLGRPLEGAVISLDPTGSSRATRTNADGRFRFDKVSSGRHEIRTTWIGYRPDDRTVEVSNDGLDVTIALEPLPFRLDTLHVEAKRTGILGTVVVHSDFRALGSAEVEVLGTSAKNRTTSDGRFDFPGLPPGGYVVLARRDGFKTRLIPVVEPRDSSVELVMALDSIVSKADKIIEGRWHDLQMRTHQRSRNNSALIPRQELAARRGQTLDLALRYAPSFLLKGLIVDNTECVYVDGKVMPGLELRDFQADDVAMVETYGRNVLGSLPDMTVEGCSGAVGQPYTVRADGGLGQTRLRLNPALVRYVYIWLKH